MQFRIITSILAALFLNATFAQQAAFTRADTLRGSNGPYRSQWNVLHYDITVEPHIPSRSIRGKNTITFADHGTTIMQIDLQQPMVLDSAVWHQQPVSFSREGNVYWLQLRDSVENIKSIPDTAQLTLHFHGSPKIAKRPPWDGGWIWAKDEHQRPWITVACQGLGASVWFPCKDFQGDEPNLGSILRIITPDSLQGVGNGTLTSRQRLSENRMMYVWTTGSTINTYNIVPTIGKLVHFRDTIMGEGGQLSLDYWVLDYHLDEARKSFKDAPRTIRAFEHWFGPYPFYKDGYKLVESPHPGMEHQSNIAYGNNFSGGYNGDDLSKTGFGLLWDFIIVHESGHEWFGNSITTEDIADMWVHEGFTHYAEALFTEYYFGQKAGKAYSEGTRSLIVNHKPMAQPQGVHQKGDPDMYFKAGAMIHMIRYWMGDDEKFRQMLREMNKRYAHSIVTGLEIQQFIMEYSGLPLTAFFQQYLHTTKVPELEYKISKGKLYYQWNNVVDGFNMPVTITDKRGKNSLKIYPEKGKWKRSKWKAFDISVDTEWYIQSRKVN